MSLASATYHGGKQECRHTSQDRVGDGEEDTRDLRDDAEKKQEATADVAGGAVRAACDGNHAVVLADCWLRGISGGHGDNRERDLQIATGGFIMRPEMHELMPSARMPPCTRLSKRGPSMGSREASDEAVMSPVASQARAM